MWTFDRVSAGEAVHITSFRLHWANLGCHYQYRFSAYDLFAIGTMMG
jgi:hypothetical protein